MTLGTHYPCGDPRTRENSCWNGPYPECRRCYNRRRERRRKRAREAARLAPKPKAKKGPTPVQWINASRSVIESCRDQYEAAMAQQAAKVGRPKKTLTVRNVA